MKINHILEHEVNLKTYLKNGLQTIFYDLNECKLELSNKSVARNILTF